MVDIGIYHMKNQCRYQYLPIPQNVNNALDQARQVQVTLTSDFIWEDTYIFCCFFLKHSEVGKWQIRSSAGIINVVIDIQEWNVRFGMFYWEK